MSPADPRDGVLELALDVGLARPRAQTEIDVEIAGRRHEGRLVGPAALDGADAALRRHQPRRVGLGVLREPALELPDDRGRAHDRVLVADEVADAPVVPSPRPAHREPGQADFFPRNGPAGLRDDRTVTAKAVLQHEGAAATVADFAPGRAGPRADRHATGPEPGKHRTANGRSRPARRL